MSEPQNKETEAAPPRKPKNPVHLDFDRLASVFAVALSTAAILVSLFEVSAARSQQKASVWPYINLVSSYNQQGFSLTLTNKGVGPAKLRDLTFSLDGDVQSDLDDMILTTLGEEQAFSYDVYSASNPRGSVIARGETVNLFSIPWEPRTRKLVEAWEDSADVEVCYCSIYDECWTTRLSMREPAPIEVCPSDE